MHKEMQKDAKKERRLLAVLDENKILPCSGDAVYVVPIVAGVRRGGFGVEINGGLLEAIVTGGSDGKLCPFLCITVIVNVLKITAIVESPNSNA